MKTHKCQCGNHDLPGEVLLRAGNEIVVLVDAPNGQFVEHRKLMGSTEPNRVHEERLIQYWRIRDGRVKHVQAA